MASIVPCSLDQAVIAFGMLGEKFEFPSYGLCECVTAGWLRQEFLPVDKKKPMIKEALSQEYLQKCQVQVKEKKIVKSENVIL